MANRVRAKALLCFHHKPLDALIGANMVLDDVRTRKDEMMNRGRIRPQEYSNRYKYTNNPYVFLL